MKLITAIMVALVAMTGMAVAMGNGPSPMGAAAIAAELSAAGYPNDVQVRAGALGYNVVVRDVAGNMPSALGYALGATALQMVKDGDADAYSQVGAATMENGQVKLYAVAVNGGMANQMMTLYQTDKQGMLTYVNGILNSADATVLDEMPASLSKTPIVPQAQQQPVTRVVYPSLT